MLAGAGALPQPVLASILAVCWAIYCSITLRVLVKGDTGGGGGPRSPLRWAGGEVGVPPLRWVDCLPPQASLERKGERGGAPPLLACYDQKLPLPLGHKHLLHELILHDHLLLEGDFRGEVGVTGAPKQDLEFGTFLKEAPQRQNLVLSD